MTRDSFKATICVGTSAIYRREALALLGGIYKKEHSEDLYTGFYAVNNGWECRYLPLNLSMGCCPDTLSTFFTQQYRWASGSASLCTSKMFWKSNLTLIQKFCFLSGMFYYSCTALGIFFTPLSSILLICLEPSKIIYYNISFSIPSFIFSVCFMRCWSKQPFRLYVLKIRIFTNYSSLIAIFDKILKTKMEWKVSGAKNKNDIRFKYAITILIVWSTITTSFTIGIIIWRSFEYQFYNFIPTLVLTLFNFFLTIEIFTGENYRNDILKKIKILCKRNWAAKSYRNFSRGCPLVTKSKTYSQIKDPGDFIIYLC
jgi:hypothetical protein